MGLAGLAFFPARIGCTVNCAPFLFDSWNLRSGFGRLRGSGVLGDFGWGLRSMFV